MIVAKGELPKDEKTCMRRNYYHGQFAEGRLTGLADKILVVDDEQNIVTLISVTLQRAGYTVVTACDGLAALEKARTEKPALVLLDVMLPHLDGFAVCEQLRKVDNTPVIMITAKNTEMEKVWGLEVGADDYITKPFSPRELLARIKAVLRRTGSDNSGATHLNSNGVDVDLLAHRATLNDAVLNLTPKEYDLLIMLMQGRNRVFSRDELLQQLWGYEYDGDSRTVDVHIRRLRQKLGDDTERPKFIETAHGVGYRWTEPSNA